MALVVMVLVAMAMALVMMALLMGRYGDDVSDMTMTSPQRPDGGRLLDMKGAEDLAR